MSHALLYRVLGTRSFVGIDGANDEIRTGWEGSPFSEGFANVDCGTFSTRKYLPS